MRISRQALAGLVAATSLAALAAAGGLHAVFPNPDRAASAAPDRDAVADAIATRGPAVSAAAAKGPKPLRLEGIHGGDLARPLVSDGLVYVPTGRTITVWDYARPANPQRLATLPPVPGAVQSVVRNGNHLYASWRQGSCRRGGVTVYALGDPRSPRKVGQVAQYAGKVERTCAAGLVAAKGRLYLFDTENDLYVGNLDDPKKPRFLPSGIGPGVGSVASAHGNLLWAAGRTFLGGQLLRSIDVSVPDVPRAAAAYSSPGTDIFSVAFQGRQTLGFGHRLSVLDLTDPLRIEMVGSAEMPYGATTGVKLGQHVYSAGFHGLDIWSLADPSRPLFLDNHDLRTFSVREAVPLKGRYGLLLGTDDRMTVLDARRPEKPAFASERLQAGGVNAEKVVNVAGYAVVLQYDYGITVADPRTLVPLARLEPPMDDDPQARGYSDIAVHGRTAYLAAWGYGVIVVDLSNPLKPREIARLPYPFASSVLAAGNRLYVGKNTNGPSLGVVDVTDPSQPALLSNWSLPDAPWKMAAKGDVLMYAETGNSEGPGGVRILDAADPQALTQLARWEGDCKSATDVALKGRHLYVACRTGLRILDVAAPDAPRLVGGAWADESASTFAAVAVRGQRAWYASGAGLEEYDVSAVRSPRLLARTDLAGYQPSSLDTAPDGRVLVPTGEAGVYVFAPR